MKITLAVIAIIIIVAGFFYFRQNRPPSVTGIGVEVMLRNNSLQIMEVMQDTPAARAGLSGGLIIQQIDEVTTAGRPLAECVAMMRGAVGSKIQLELVDPAKNTTNVVTFTREKLHL